MLLKQIKNKLGDIDVATSTQLIEVKASLQTSSSKFQDLLNQIDKYINPSNAKFMNFDGKEVVVYFDNTIDMSNQYNVQAMETLKSKGVLVVNGLDQLIEVLK